MDNLVPACRPRAEERDDDCVGRFEVGEREASKLDADVVGGDRCDLEGARRCIPWRSSKVNREGSMESSRPDNSDRAVYVWACAGAFKLLQNGMNIESDIRSYIRLTDGSSASGGGSVGS